MRNINIATQDKAEDGIMSGQLLNLEDYKKFFEDTPVAFIRTDLKTGEFLMANRYAAQLFGYDNVEELKANARTIDLYPPEARRDLIRVLKKQGHVEGYEIQFTVNGKTVWVSACLHINCGGTCVEGSLCDITPHIEARNKQLGQLKEIGKKLDKKIAAFAS